MERNYEILKDMSLFTSKKTATAMAILYVKNINPTNTRAIGFLMRPGINWLAFMILLLREI